MDGLQYQETIRTRYPHIVPLSLVVLFTCVGVLMFLGRDVNQWLLRLLMMLAVAGGFGLVSIPLDRYKRIEIGNGVLRVGRDRINLDQLSGPVLHGDEAWDQVRGTATLPWKAKETPRHRFLGGSSSTTIGQDVVLVGDRRSRKQLAIGTWFPEKLAAALQEAIDDALFESH